jgi:hypothetical protein
MLPTGRKGIVQSNVRLGHTDKKRDTRPAVLDRMLFLAGALGNLRLVPCWKTMSTRGLRKCPRLDIAENGHL